jgi:AcrR family transcriptional regulator
MSGSKDKILDAAEEIVLRDGVAHLTLDAVAQECQISKGGLLYHFPSKEALISGMINRLHRLYEAEVERLEGQDPNPVGRRLRAMINASFPKEPCCDFRLRIDRISAGLLAAVATNPMLLKDVQAFAGRMEKALMNDGVDPVIAVIIHLATDGIWMSGLFGIPHPSGELREMVLDRLREMTMQYPAAAADPAGGSEASK